VSATDPEPADGVAIGEAVDEQSDEELLTKGARTQRQILDLAISHFGRLGYRATSVSQITREAGLTQAAAYTYFDNKEALFRAAVNADVENLISSATEPAAGVDVDDLIATILVFLAAKLGDHPLAVRVLAGQEPDAMGQLRELPALLEVRSTLAERFAQAQDAGEIRPDIDPVKVATGLQVIVLALLTSIVQGQASAPSESGEAPDPAIIDGVLSVFAAVLHGPD
jgi:AcrR family transcriptional regulator